MPRDNARSPAVVNRTGNGAGAARPIAIEVDEARTHNLKGIDCRVPHGAVTVVTGPSGAGKSSLAFDTIFAEGQRRFVESMSTYARQFLDQMERPPVDDIEQRPAGGGARGQERGPQRPLDGRHDHRDARRPAPALHPPGRGRSARTATARRAASPPRRRRRSSSPARRATVPPGRRALPRPRAPAPTPRSPS